MAFLQVDFFSETFGMSMNMNVILPQEIQVPNPVNGGRFPKPYPVMYLLHGWNGDHTVWERRTSIERYAAQTGIAIVMPAVHLSFYSDMACGLPYWTYLSQELPNVCGQMFPQLSTRREDTWAAGLSMGGYGALKLALGAPERFSIGASLSGAVDVASMVHRMASAPAPQEDGITRPKLSFFKIVTSIFGPEDQISGSENDLFALAQTLKEEGKPMPRLYQWCGKQDPLYQDNCRLRDYLTSQGFPLTWEDSDGDHQWEYWDAKIADVLQWIGTQREINR